MTMPPLRPSLDELLRRRRLPWLVLALILAVFALAIAQVTQRMRSRIRQQILNRDAEVLRAMVAVQFGEVAADIQAEVREPADLWVVLLEASRARGVVATRLFDTNGICDATMPFDITAVDLAASDLHQVLDARPVTRFREGVPAAELYVAGEIDGEARGVLNLVEVTVPLQARAGTEVVGIGQFVLAGEDVAREFGDLDRSLLVQASVILGLGGTIIGLSVGLAFRRLQGKHRLLADRTRDLLLANEELARSARTSAIGSVAAHLIHGLKNPLSGLQQFVRERTLAQPGIEDSLWQDAVASTRRMQEMVAEVVRVLREEGQGDAYELTLAELGEVVRRRMEPQARAAGVDLKCRCNGEGRLDNRQANLVNLILANLLENAIQASPRESEVELEIVARPDGLCFRVCDRGTGLPDAVRNDLFAPCRSTREGGTGIGLAISKQLAVHLGAELRLEQSSVSGTVFVLKVPVRRPVESLSPDEPALRR